ncbi:hypothetical protein HPHPP26_0114 [Helicobacter pylori Hp P-26]|nr:hypothetical protein HPHPP26_0114 [Helicobacter pylori Hp P-26]
MSFWGMMITEYFYILLRKSKEKSFLQTNLKQPKLKKPLFYSYPHSNNLISFKMTFIGLIFV